MAAGSVTCDPSDIVELDRAHDGSGAGDAFADFLLGRPSAFNQAQPFTPTGHMNYVGSYVQDAWTVTPKTVLRGGGGIYYVRDIGNAVFDTVRNAPFTIRRDEPAESFRPNLSYEQPFARTGAPTFILANQWDEPSTYITQWSLGVQREFGSFDAFVWRFVDGKPLRRKGRQAVPARTGE